MQRVVMNKLLMIDNYDSFTYNLVQYFGELGQTVLVHRNDQITLDDVEALNPDRICISPGPCSPAEAGISVDLMAYCSTSDVDTAERYRFVMSSVTLPDVGAQGRNPAY